MKYFSNFMIYPILPYDVWEIIVRFYDSPDFTDHTISRHTLKERGSM